MKITIKKEFHDMGLRKLGQYFDYPLLKACATYDELEELCQKGARHNVRMVTVTPAAVSFCVRRGGTPVSAAIDFPMGQATFKSKVYEAKDAIANGASEVEYVVNLTEVKKRNKNYLTTEMRGIVDMCRISGVVVKAVFENCYLTDEEKKFLCTIANEVRPDYIKTSTGLGTGGATVYDVLLMRQYTDSCVSILASGDIKIWEDAENLIDAGASRISTSHTITILNELARNGVK